VTLLAAESPATQQAAADALFALVRELLEGTWRGAFTRAVDYSAHATLTVDATLPPGTCRVPRGALTELFKPWVYGALEELGYVTTIKSAKLMLERGVPEAQPVVDVVSGGYPLLLVAGERVVSRTPLAWDAPAIAVDADTAALLASTEVSVFVPLSTQAALECERLPRELPAAGAPTGWFARAREGSLLDAVREVAATGARDPLEDVVSRVVLGLPPAPPPDAELEQWEAAFRARRAMLAGPTPAEPEHSEWLSRSIDELEVSVRTANTFSRLGLKTVGDLCRLTESDLLKSEGFGRGGLKEVKELLADLGLSLGMTQH
jgi:hypothetical protein